MRLMRAYAPPANLELNCYREIRKWINAVISYIRANEFRNERYTNIGNGRWISLFNHPVFCAPCGHELAVALDKLPELLSLLQNFKECVLVISSSSTVKKSSTYAADCMDDTKLGVADEALSQGREAIKKRKPATYITQFWSNKRRQFSQTTEYDEAHNSIREENLLKILSLFLKIESLCIDESPSFLEVRLYDQVLEHVNLSVWMFDAINDFEKSDELEKYRRMTDIVSWNSSDQVHNLLGAQIILNEEARTRVQYLEEAVCLVDAIKASYRCTVPTAREMVLYWKLSEHVRDDFLQSGCNWKLVSQDVFYAVGPAEEGTPEKVALLKYMTKAVFDKEIEILRMTIKERLHVEQAFKGLKEEGINFTCQEEWDYLALRILLVLDEVYNLLYYVSSDLEEANSYLDSLLENINATVMLHALTTVSAADC